MAFVWVEEAGAVVAISAGGRVVRVMDTPLIPHTGARGGEIGAAGGDTGGVGGDGEERGGGGGGEVDAGAGCVSGRGCGWVSVRSRSQSGPTCGLHALNMVMMFWRATHQHAASPAVGDEATASSLAKRLWGAEGHHTSPTDLLPGPSTLLGLARSRGYSALGEGVGWESGWPTLYHRPALIPSTLAGSLPSPAAASSLCSLSTHPKPPQPPPPPPFSLPPRGNVQRHSTRRRGCCCWLPLCRSLPRPHHHHLHPL